MNTTEWLEDARTSFKEAIDSEDFKTASVILADIRDVSQGIAQTLLQEFEEAKELYDHAVRLSDDAERRSDQMREEDLG